MLNFVTSKQSIKANFLRGRWQMMARVWDLDFFIQPWPTQVGSRAKFLLNREIKGQNMEFSKDLVDLSPKKRYFRERRRAALESFEGRGLAMACFIIKKMIDKFCVPSFVDDPQLKKTWVILKTMNNYPRKFPGKLDQVQQIHSIKVFNPTIPAKETPNNSKNVPFPSCSLINFTNDDSLEVSLIYGQFPVTLSLTQSMKIKQTPITWRWP